MDCWRAAVPWHTIGQTVVSAPAPTGEPTLEPLTLAEWAFWPLFAYSVSTALEPWAKLEQESLPIIQRVLSLLLAVSSFPFGIWMLWRAYSTWGIGHTVRAFFTMWLGMLALTVVIAGGYSVLLKSLVSDPEQRMAYFRGFRYGLFWPALFAAVIFAYKLFGIYP